MKMLIGPDSGDFYVFSEKTNDFYAYMLRLSPDLDLKVQKGYQYRYADRSFELNSDETRLFAIRYRNDYLQLLMFNPVDFSVLGTKKSTSYTCQDDRCRVIQSPEPEIIYLSASGDNNHKPTLCKVNVTEPKFFCTQDILSLASGQSYQNYVFQTIQMADDGNLVAMSNVHNESGSSKHTPVFFKVDMSALSVSWIKKFSYTFDLQLTEICSVIDSPNQHTYFSFFTGTNEGLYFYKVSLSNGDPEIQKKLEIETCTQFTNMELHDQDVAFGAHCVYTPYSISYSYPFIFIFDTVNDYFEVLLSSRNNDYQLLATYILYWDNFGRYVFGGVNQNNAVWEMISLEMVGYSKFYFNSSAFNDGNFTTSTVHLVEDSSLSSPTSISLTEIAFVDGTNPTELTTDLDEKFEEIDVLVTEEQEYNFTVEAGKNETREISAAVCTEAEVTYMFADITSGWSRVNYLDVIDDTYPYQLEINVPSSYPPETCTLRMYSKYFSKSIVTKINLEVTPACAVDSCEDCYSDNHESCETCASGFEPRIIDETSGNYECVFECQVENCQWCEVNQTDTCEECISDVYNPTPDENGKYMCERICTPENCETCEEDSTESCQKCTSGFKTYSEEGTENQLCTPECEDDGCEKCEIGSATKCLACKDGFESENSENEEEGVQCFAVQAIPAGVQAAGAGAAAGAGFLSGVFSACNMSPPSGLWMTMNQFQLILLIMLTKAFIPTSIVDYLNGLKVTTCSFNFIPFAKIPGVKSLVDWFDFGLEWTELESFGIFSGSSFVNNFSLLCIYLIFLLFHALFTLLFEYCKPTDPEKENCAKRWDKAFQIFNISIYIRLFLQANQFLLLSSFAELYTFRMDNTRDQLSMLISLVNALLCVGLIYICFAEWYQLKNREVGDDQHLYFKEIMAGVKQSKRGRIYPTLLLGRRFLLVAFLICAQRAPSMSILITITLIQVCYFCAIVCLRPFREVKDNMIEVTNEVFFTLIVGLLLHFNQRENWSTSVEKAYLMLIMVNSGVVILIMIVGAAHMGCKKCSKKSNETQVEPKPRLEEEKHNNFSNLAVFRNKNPSMEIPSHTQNEAESHMGMDMSRPSISNPTDNTRVQISPITGKPLPPKPKLGGIEFVNKSRQNLEYWSNYNPHKRPQINLSPDEED